MRYEREKGKRIWTEEAGDLLRGRTVIDVRYMTERERKEFNWHASAAVIVFADGLLLYPSVDEEGNDAGVLFTTSEICPVIPKI